MRRKRLRRGLTALIVLLVLAGANVAQTRPAATTASAPAQRSELPWRRDLGASDPIARSAGWAVLFLGIVAGLGYVLVRRRRVRSEVGAGWTRFSPGASVPRAPWRMALTPQATLHLVEWHGEELLVGCTPQSVTLLARRLAGASSEAADREQGKP